MSENRYLEDKSINQDEGLLNMKSLIIGSAITAGSILAYRGGAFRNIIKETMKETAAHKPTVSILFNDLRKWTKSDFDVPDKSIFRASFKSTIKEFVKFDKNAAKGVIDATKEDIGLYKKRVNNTIKRVTTDMDKYYVKNSHHNTDLLKNLKDIDNAMAMYSDSKFTGKRAMKTKAYESLIKKSVLSDKKAAESIKRTGVKKATLEDLFDIEIQKNGKVKLTEKTKFNFSDKEHGDVKSAISHIEDMLNYTVVTESGVTIKNNGRNLRIHEKYKDDFRKITLDDSLHFTKDKKGSSIIDLRNQKKQTQETIRNLSTEWKIPLISINPMRMLGFNKIGKRKIHVGSISEDTVAPFLTGVKGGGKHNTIKNLKSQVDIIKDVDEGVTIIDGDVYRMSKDGKGIVKMDYKAKKELVFIPKENDRTSSLTRRENSLRKMSGLSTKEYESYKKEDGYKYYKDKVAKFFDVGYQENDKYKNALDNALEYTNVDSYIEKLITKVTPSTAKEVKNKKTFSSTLNADDNTLPRDSFFVINKNISLKDVAVNNFNKKDISNYFKQYVGDFKKDYETVNKNTGKLYFMLERMNQNLSSVGLGLGSDSIGSSWDVAKNLILKRVLPVYGAYQAYQFINMIGEDDTEGGTKPSTFHQRLLSTISKADIAMHSVTEKLGLPTFLENLSELTPGSDMLEELPGITNLNLHQTAEERKDYWEKGYDPVRKGRFWSLNDTPFIGGKVKYYKANPLRSAMADAKFSDSLYGSRKEYYSQLLNTGYYDKRNYKDRPYLMSSAAFENVPLVGNLLSATVGRVIKPPKKMHEEYWNLEENRPKTPEELKQEEELRAVVAGQSSQIGYIENFNNINLKQEQIKKEMYTKDKMTIFKIFGFGSNKEEFAPIAPNTSLIPQVSNITAYRTPGGKINSINLGENKISKMYKINNQNYTLGQIQGISDEVSLTDNYIVSKDVIENGEFSDVKNPYSLSTALKDQYVDLANVSGIYGFGVTGFLTGNLGAGDAVIETSGYSRSFNRAFWDKELGGMGGDVSEIFRRFVQKRRTDVNYYNPVRNTQANWMPGEGAFIDFQHGDPFIKVARGEERLIGEGYERLHGIDMEEKLKLKIGSSSLGKTKDEIIKHLIHQDEITDKGLQKIVDTGTKYHEQIESDMINSGLAIDSEIEIKDEKNGIIGYYDLRIYDKHSITGEAIMDIKTISQKGFDEVKRNKAPKDLHQRQVNWYLHHTNKLNKGYVMYVNRDNPEETYTVGFNYSKKMYQSSLDTLNQARNEVRTMIDNGTLSRGDLYNPIDKFRILADVAPYSDEFAEMNQMISNLDLTKEEEEEVRAIKDRVSEVRKPMRLYDYRFKYSDIQKEKITLGSMIEEEIFNVKGSDTPIKLSGVKINKSHKKYKEAMAFLEEHMNEGKNVTIGVSKDLSMRRNNDQLRTVKAVVYSDGMNINKELIKRGLAEEKKDDYSPTGVHARFNILERNFGKAWENIAHFDSLANTKFLQVRTAAEDYERKQVYGKDFKEWSKPVRDFLMPAIWKNTERSLIGGVAVGAGIGYMFGATKFGRLVGSVTGAAVIMGSKAYKAGYEATTGENWIPKEKRREREINDYMDKLKFIKNRRLFEIYADKALNEDGIDVKQIIQTNNEMGEDRKRQKRKIQNVKKDYKRTGDFNIKDFEDAGVEFDKTDKLPSLIRGILKGDTGKKIVENTKKLYNLDKGEDFVNTIKEYSNILKEASAKKRAALEKKVNETINEKAENRRTFDLSENALKAIEYYNESEKTMYGFDPGESIQNIMIAMPKKDRRYFKEFLDAPEAERERILEIAPKYMKRALQASYGMKVDKKEDLSSYFSKHYLPGEDWDGWQEGFNLDAMKVKIVNNSNLNPGSFDIWEDDVREANLYGPIAVPNVNYKTKNVEVVKRKLQNVLGDAGYENLEFSFRFGTRSNTINMDLYEDRKEKFENKIRERLGVY